MQKKVKTYYLSAVVSPVVVICVCKRTPENPKQILVKIENPSDGTEKAKQMAKETVDLLNKNEHRIAELLSENTDLRMAIAESNKRNSVV